MTSTGGTEPVEPAEDIVVGVDGSAVSKDALRWAARQARMTGSSLRVVSSWNVPAQTYGGMAFWPEGLDLAETTRVMVCDTVAEVLGPEPAIPVICQVVEGPPALELLDVADDADLLVVGSRGHGAFVGMLLGSVSGHCVMHAACPVVVVRPARSPEDVRYPALVSVADRPPS